MARRKVWVTNILDPNLANGSNDPTVIKEAKELEELLSRVHLGDFRNPFGEPRATKKHTVAALKKQGIIGLYEWVDDEKEAV